MHIGIIVDNELNNDIRVLREIRILRDAGHDIKILCFDFGNNLPDPVEGIQLERIRLNKKIKNSLFFLFNFLPLYEWFWTFAISRFISKNNISAVHAHDLYMSKAAAVAIRHSGKKIPLVLDLHENYPHTIRTYNWTKGFLRSRISKPGKWMIKEAEYLAYASRLIVLSEDYKEALCTKYSFLDKNNLCIVPNLPEISANISELKVNKQELFHNEYPVLLYYGVIAERRGVFDALEVFSSLADEAFPLNFLFIGPVDKKDQQEFNSVISKARFSGLIKHIPWINQHDLPAYLSICDIGIAPFHKNPQHESGVANKIYDYMSGSLPLIVSDCKPQKELVEVIKCGLVFSDPVEMKEKIRILASDFLMREQMGRRGAEAIKERYNASATAVVLTNLYKSLT